MRDFLKIILCVLCLFFFCCPITVQGKEGEAEDLPQIARWEDGKGYDAGGAMITGGWAYDTVNSAGKYVLFGEDGAVMQKADKKGGEDGIRENFTATEQEPATVALRAEAFPGFAGNISVVLEEKSGVQSTYSLSQDNLYAFNVPVNSGDYRIRQAEADDGQFVYRVEFSPEQYHVQEKWLLLLKLKVTEEKQGEVAQNQKTDEDKPEGKEEGQENKMEGNDGKKEGSMTGENGTSKKYIILISGIVAAGFAGCLLFRNRRDKYN